jgi:hypothetical protein
MVRSTPEVVKERSLTHLPRVRRARDNAPMPGVNRWPGLNQRVLLPLAVGGALLLALAAWRLGGTAMRERAGGPPDVTATPTAEAAGELPADLALQDSPAEPSSSSAGAPRRLVDTTSPEGPAAGTGSAFVGSVADARGPVAGARVWLFDRADGPGHGAPTAEGSSDDQGRFRLEARTPGQEATLLAQASGHLPRTVRVFAGVAAEVRLSPAAGLAGRVVTAGDLEPVPGAEVSVARGAFQDGGWIARVTSRTDAEGSFRIELAAPGIERLTVTRPGMLPETMEVQVPEEGGEGYELRVTAPLARLALVDLATGAALADTTVECRSGVVRTDAAGLLAIPAGRFADDEPIDLRVRLPGEPWTCAEIEPERPLPTLPLARGAHLVGTVVDASDAPVAGASVQRVGGGRPSEVTGLPEGVWLEEGPTVSTTDEDGSFRITGLLPRSNPLYVRGRHPELASGLSEPVEVAVLGAEVHVQVRLERGATVTGFVTVDGEPASLPVTWAGERGRGRTQSDGTGAYRLLGVPAGTIRLGARLEVEDRDFLGDESVELTVEDGSVVEQDLARTSRSTRLAGRVLDELGRPLEGISVRAFAREPGARTVHHESTRSDEAGRFAVEVPLLETPAGSDEVLWQVRASDGERQVTQEEVRAGTIDLLLVLPARARLAIEVLEARTHQPLDGFQLYWRLHEAPAPLDGIAGPEGEVAGLGWERVRVGDRSPAAGPDGRFVVELPAARLDLVATAPRHALPEVETIDLAPDGSTGTVRFRLDEDVPLVVEVVAADDEEGASQRLEKGLRDLVVHVVPAALWADRRRGGELLRDLRRHGTRDEEGRTVIRGLGPGPVQVVDEPRGTKLTPARLVLPATDRHRVRLEAHVAGRGAKPGRQRR